MLKNGQHQIKTDVIADERLSQARADNSKISSYRIGSYRSTVITIYVGRCKQSIKPKTGIILKA